MSENDTLAEDGLLYCEKCHTPVQCRRLIFGKLRTLPCSCKCRQEEMQRQKEETEAREHMMRIQRLKSTGILERHLLDWDTAEDTETIRWAKNYVENWKQVRAENLGLLLWGDVGTGKSFAAACNSVLPGIVDHSPSVYGRGEDSSIASEEVRGYHHAANDRVWVNRKAGSGSDIVSVRTIFG